MLDNYDYSKFMQSNPDLCRSVKNGKTLNIIKYITLENKLDIIMYIMKNRPYMIKTFYKHGIATFSDICKAISLRYELLKDVPSEIYRDSHFKDFILTNGTSEWYDYLPLELLKDKDIKNACNRKKRIYSKEGLDFEGFNREWIDKYGNLIHFFSLKDQFPIKSKEDYYKLYEEYINSNTSVSLFCNKYGISSTKGFNRLLERIANENSENASEIDKVKKDVSQKYYNLAKDVCRRIMSNELTIEEFLKTTCSFESTKIDLYYRFMTDEEKNIFSKKIMDYFEEHQLFFHKGLWNFLNNHQLKASDSYNSYIKANLIPPMDKEYYVKYKDQIRMINSHMLYYKREEFLKTSYIINDESIPVTEDIIDEAYSYLYDNEFHISYLSMQTAIKKIIKGELSYNDKYIKQKEELIDDIAMLIEENKNIVDYINAVKSTYEKNNNQTQNKKV